MTSQTKIFISTSLHEAWKKMFTENTPIRHFIKHIEIANDLGEHGIAQRFCEQLRKEIEIPIEFQRRFNLAYDLAQSHSLQMQN